MHKLPENYVEVAWNWFVTKYGLLLDSKIGTKGDVCAIKLRFGLQELEIVFPLTFILDSPINPISIKGFGINTNFIGEMSTFSDPKNGVIFVQDSKNTNSVCGVIKQKRLILGFDPFAFIYLAISGMIEKELHNIYLTLVKEPYLDSLSEIIFRTIQHLAINNGYLLITKSFWPNGKHFAVCLTHDVDEIRKTYQYITRSIRFLKRLDFAALKNEFISLLSKLKGNDPYWTFDEIIGLEKNLGVRSSFYFLKERGKVKISDKKTWRHLGRRYSFKEPKLIEIIRKLQLGGWEVGLHGSFYSYNDFNLLKKEKEELEEVLGDKVVGIRQHNLNLSIPETWRIHEALGFEYDTTLGSNHYVGFRWGTCFPFYPYDMKGDRFLKVLQIPLHIEDIVVFRHSNPWKVCVQMVERVQRYGGELTLLWHHSVFNEIDYPNWTKVYKDLIEYCKKKGAWLTDASNLAKWWKQRKESSPEVKYKKKTVLISSKNNIPPLRIYFDKKIDVQPSEGAQVFFKNNSIEIYIESEGTVEIKCLT